MPAPMTSTLRLGAASAALLASLVLAAPVAAQPGLGVSATMTGPDPSPLAIGGTATFNVEFAVPGDVGPVTVGIEIQDSGGTVTLRLDAALTSTELVGCVETPTLVTCDWDGELADGPQTLAVFIDAGPGAEPNSGLNLSAIVDSAATDPEIVAEGGIFVTPPVGTTQLSGQVITEGGTPVPGACIFLLVSAGYADGTIADAQGMWSFEGLPDDYRYIVIAIAPFDGPDGPCSAEGPPPAPPAGELQPVFSGDVWIDLTDPGLIGPESDPFAYAVARGAVELTGTTGGIVSCLTSAPGDVVPRPACIAAATTTTTTSTTTTTTSTTTTATMPSTTTAPEPTTTATGDPAAPTTIDPEPSIPATGSGVGVLMVAAVAALLAGATALAATRGRRRT